MPINTKVIVQLFLKGKVNYLLTLSYIVLIENILINLSFSTFPFTICVGILYQTYEMMLVCQKLYADDLSMYFHVFSLGTVVHV